MNLEDLAHKIQGLDKSHHIEILRLIKETNPSCSISENKNGCFINMNELNMETIVEISKYVEYNESQEHVLEEQETIKNNIIETMNQ